MLNLFSSVKSDRIGRDDVCFFETILSIDLLAVGVESKIVWDVGSVMDSLNFVFLISEVSCNPRNVPRIRIAHERMRELRLYDIPDLLPAATY